MSASIGIWAQGDVNGDVVLYRWEADRQAGFVAFEVRAQRIRPSDESGRPLGSLLFDAAVGEPSGSAEGVDIPLFIEIVVALMRIYRRAGCAPATAHAYYL
ncbi:hypothetical protein [Paractinoplanes atraurantiacus]|uniref:Uncharacterized protein n=1 Tax=Paractinoplanes atraurantiacus TaxID=1036182 RepID=A0A285JPW4_9ACTN|nr:hypothetical protein [Actinoplanes atraurantiacus]SNY62308.1 hypothetical protein SAMN05421748_123123 [Actinoplanes atraurantiacus]